MAWHGMALKRSLGPAWLCRQAPNMCKTTKSTFWTHPNTKILLSPLSSSPGPGVGNTREKRWLCLSGAGNNGICRQLKSQFALKTHPGSTHWFLSAAAEDKAGPVSLPATSLPRDPWQTLSAEGKSFSSSSKSNNLGFFYNLKHQQWWEELPRAPGLCADPTEGLAGIPQHSQGCICCKIPHWNCSKIPIFPQFCTSRPVWVYRMHMCVCIFIYFILVYFKFFNI